MLRKLSRSHGACPVECHIETGLSVTRKTAAHYLSSLEREGFLITEKIGKERMYQNKRLYNIVKHG